MTHPLLETNPKSGGVKAQRGPDHGSAFRAIPVLTLGITAVVLLIGAVDSLAASLQFDRAAIAAGEWWRLLTGHLAHWSRDHLFWDLAVFAVLGAICEREDRQRFALCGFLSAVAISVGIWLLLPDLTTYRGLSGVDSALFALLVGTILRTAVRDQRWTWVAGASLLLIGFLGKTVFEVATGATLFVDSTGSGMIPIPLAHVLGAAAGLTLGMVRRAAGDYCRGTETMFDSRATVTATGGLQTGSRTR